MMIKNYLTKLLYKLISLIDYIDYHYIRKEYLIDNYKTVEEIELYDDIQILTDTGYKPLSHLMITKPFEIWTIKLENGYELDCADEHSVFDENFNKIYVENLSIGQSIMTDEGPKKIISLTKSSTKISMCDTTVNDENHRFYSNGILSHNSVTTAIYCLWSILFNNDKKGLILSKSGPAGVDLLRKIKDMYRFLPYHIKCGTMVWNQHEISFDNNSSISTEAFSPTAGLGKTINFLILDEFAWCPQGDVELFYNNIIPTVTTISNSNVCIMSTQNGFNLFYKLWKAAEEGKSVYAPFNVDWWQVPQFNPETKQWEKRTEAWRQEQIGILGSVEDFEYQYGTAFTASDACILTRQGLSSFQKNAVKWECNNNVNELLYAPNKQYLVWDPEYNILEHVNTIMHQSDRYYLVLVDLAEGGGGDYTVFNFFEIGNNKTYKHIARWSSNTVDLAHAALDFWIIWCQLFNNDKTIISIEWNTYGALFYQYLMNYNEHEYDIDNSWRFNIPYVMNYGDYLDMTNIIRYKNKSMESEISKAGTIKKKTTETTIPGIRFSSSNKVTACSMLKIKLEHGDITTTDIVTINEIENFEDKNGNGSYKASYGHDDSIMTFCQIPMLESTLKYNNILEEMATEDERNNMMSKWNGNPESEYSMSNSLYDMPMFNSDLFQKLE